MNFVIINKVKLTSSIFYICRDRRISGSRHGFKGTVQKQDNQNAEDK